MNAVLQQPLPLPAAVPQFEDIFFLARYTNEGGYVAGSETAETEAVRILFRRASQDPKHWFHSPPANVGGQIQPAFLGSIDLESRSRRHQVNVRQEFEDRLRTSGLWMNDVVVNANEQIYNAYRPGNLSTCGMIGRITRVQWVRLCDVYGQNPPAYGKVPITPVFTDDALSRRWPVWRPRFTIDFGVYQPDIIGGTANKHKHWDETLWEYTLFDNSDFTPQGVAGAADGWKYRIDELNRNMTPLQHVIWPIRDVYANNLPGGRFVHDISVAPKDDSDIWLNNGYRDATFGALFSENDEGMEGIPNDDRGVRLGRRPAEFNMFLQLRYYNTMITHKNYDYPLQMLFMPLLRRIRDARAGKLSMVFNPVHVNLPPGHTIRDIPPIVPHAQSKILLSELIRRCHKSNCILEAFFPPEVRAMISTVAESSLQFDLGDDRNAPDDAANNRRLEEEYREDALHATDVRDTMGIPARYRAPFAKLRFYWRIGDGITARREEYLNDFSVFRVDCNRRDNPNSVNNPFVDTDLVDIWPPPAGGVLPVQAFGRYVPAAIDNGWVPLHPRRLRERQPAVQPKRYPGFVQDGPGANTKTISDDAISMYNASIGRRSVWTYVGMLAHERAFFKSLMEPMRFPTSRSAANADLYMDAIDNRASLTIPNLNVMPVNQSTRTISRNGPRNICVQPVIDSLPRSRQTLKIADTGYLGGAFAGVTEKLYTVDSVSLTAATADNRGQTEDPTSLEYCVRVYQENFDRAIQAYFSDKRPGCHVHKAALELPVYNPFCVFSKTVDAKDRSDAPARMNDIRMYETRFDAVLHVKDDPAHEQGDVYLLEYKDLMENSSGANAGRRVADETNMNQAMSNAVMFYFSTGVLPSHVMLVYATRRDPQLTWDPTSPAGMNRSRGVAYVVVSPFSAHKPFLYRMMSWLTSTTLGKKYAATYVDSRYIVPVDKEVVENERALPNEQKQHSAGPTMVISKTNAGQDTHLCRYSGFYGSYYENPRPPNQQDALNHLRESERFASYEPIQKLLPNCEAALWIHVAVKLSEERIAPAPPAGPPVALVNAPQAARPRNEVGDITMSGTSSKYDVYFHKGVDVAAANLQQRRMQATEPWFIVDARAPRGPADPETVDFTVSHRLENRSRHWGAWTRQHVLQDFMCSEYGPTANGRLRCKYTVFDYRAADNGNIQHEEFNTGAFGDNTLVQNLRDRTRLSWTASAWNMMRPLFSTSRSPLDDDPPLDKMVIKEPPLVYICGMSRGMSRSETVVGRRLTEMVPGLIVRADTCRARVQGDDRLEGEINPLLPTAQSIVAQMLFRIGDEPDSLDRNDRTYPNGEPQANAIARQNLNASIDRGVNRVLDVLMGHSKWQPAARITQNNLLPVLANATHLWDGEAPVQFCNYQRPVPAQPADEVLRRALHRLVNLRLLRGVLVVWGFSADEVGRLTMPVERAPGGAANQIGMAGDFLHCSQRAHWRLDMLNLPLQADDRGVNMIDKATEDMINALTNDRTAP